MPCPACGKPDVPWFKPYCSMVCKTSGAKQPEKKRVATLYDFFHSDLIAAPRDGYNIAGFVSGKEFLYFESTNLMLPAVVNALQTPDVRAVIYTNRKEAMWVKDYPQTRVKYMDKLKNNEGDGAEEVTPKLLIEKKWPRQVNALGLAAPLSGGLYAAASRASLNDILIEGSRDKGLVRALRYYMLAAYSLLDISGQESYQGLNNYVGALLVSDKGEILAAGINTGKFRHAEVSMLLSYFRKNPTATSIPENSIIFSTLTPCRGCTGYLSLAKSSNSVIYFGQKDTGKDGKVGEKISSQLSSKTKAPMGLSKEGLADSVDPSESGGEGVVSLCAASAIHKVQVDSGLASCMGGEKAIATQIGKAKDSRNILNSASEALIHKMQKTRMGGSEESQIKQSVLVYIGQWLGTSKSIE